MSKELVTSLAFLVRRCMINCLIEFLDIKGATINNSIIGVKVYDVIKLKRIKNIYIVHLFYKQNQKSKTKQNLQTT